MLLVGRDGERLEAARSELAALGVEAEHWWLVGAVIVGSAIGLYYYLRVMVTLYLAEAGMQKRDAPENWGARAGGVVVLGVALLIILLGIYPTPMIEWVRLMGGVMLNTG